MKRQVKAALQERDCQAQRNNDLTQQLQDKKRQLFSAIQVWRWRGAAAGAASPLPCLPLAATPALQPCRGLPLHAAAPSPPSCTLPLQEREGLRQQVRGLEDKCREFQQALMCRMCRSVSATQPCEAQLCGSTGRGPWAEGEAARPLCRAACQGPCVARLAAHPRASPCCLLTPAAAPACAACAGPAQLRGAALPALPLLRGLHQAALQHQPQLPRLQQLHQRLPHPAPALTGLHRTAHAACANARRPTPHLTSPQPPPLKFLSRRRPRG